jgi:hypothetical protein
VKHPGEAASFCYDIFVQEEDKMLVVGAFYLTASLIGITNEPL